DMDHPLGASPGAAPGKSLLPDLDVETIGIDVAVVIELIKPRRDLIAARVSGTGLVINDDSHWLSSTSHSRCSSSMPNMPKALKRGVVPVAMRKGGSLVSQSSSAIRSSRRARCDPTQRCTPYEKAMCGACPALRRKS